MSEAELQQAVQHLASLLGWKYYHAPDNRPNARGAIQKIVPGFPDLLLVHPERRWLIFAELKAEKGRLTPAQKNWLTWLGRIAEVYVWRPRDLNNGNIARALNILPARNTPQIEANNPE